MATTKSTTSTLNMTFDSQLIEDFLHTQEILVNSQSPSPMAVFANGNGESEALVISANSQGHNELFHVYREPLSDSGWNLYGVGAYTNGVAVQDAETAFAVGTDQQLWSNRAGRWSLQWPVLPGGAAPVGKQHTNPAYAPISVDGDGTLWVAAAGSQLFRWDTAGKNWDTVAGAPDLIQAPVGKAGNLWAILNGSPEGKPNQALHNSSGSWQSTIWPGTDPLQVTVGSDGAVWAIDNGGDLYQYVNGQWQQVAGAPELAMIAAGGGNGLWGIGLRGGQLLHHEGGAWQTVSFGAAPGATAMRVC